MRVLDASRKQLNGRRDWAFYALLGLFTAEASWLALTSRFQMAFDEAYHFSLIKFFSHHLNPIITSQSPDTYGMGAIMHNPSFLYHYLLSFPYRLVEFFSDSLRVQVISLRFLNIAIAVASLVLIKKSLRRLGLKNGLANLVVLLFAFTPIASVLSAQINYDNLVILATAGSVLLTLRLIEKLLKGQLDIWLLGSQVCVILLGSLVKFEFLPILVAIAAVDAWYLVGFWRHNRRSFGPKLRSGYQRVTGWQKALVLGTGLLGIGLFGVFYGQNIVRYHSPVPQCDQVLSVAACSKYYSWQRNYSLAQEQKSHPQPLTLNVASYSLLWAKEGYYQLFAEIVPTGGLISIHPSYYLLLIVLTVFAALCTVSQLPKILRQRWVIAVGFISLFYLICLWARNYHDYQQLGEAVAIQGRYLLPVLVYLYAVLGLGVSLALQSRRLFNVSVGMVPAVIVVVAFIYFGGFSRYVSEISPSTHWPAEQPGQIAKSPDSGNTLGQSTSWLTRLKD